MTKLSLSEDIYSRKSLKRSTSYENNQVEIDAFGFFWVSSMRQIFVWMYSMKVVREHHSLLQNPLWYIARHKYIK